MSRIIDLLNDTRLYNTNYWSRKRILVPNIVQVGTGGTGTTLVQMVANLLASFNLNSRYLIADFDVVESKNLRNQLFIEKDVGKQKADVLAKRYRAGFGVNISSYTQSYVENVELLDSLFSTEQLDCFGYTNVIYLPILISAVDNNYTRKVFHDYFEQTDTILYIDCGNASAIVPEDYPQRTQDKWTEEERKIFNQSGYNGQVVCGLKINGEVELAPVGKVFENILEEVEDEIAPSELSCSALASSSPQKLITNRFSAMVVAGYLNELFDTGTISSHYTVFHALKKYMRSIPIE